MKRESLVVGMDFGTDTVRTIVADAADGEVLGASVKPYPRWAEGLYCDALENRFRHHPLDYLEVLEPSAADALAQAGQGAGARVRGIAADTTGSTPALADVCGRPLALSPELAEDPDAMFILWKDHTSVAQAERINQLARTWGGVDYTKYEGGIYSTEWFWAKALRVFDRDGAAARAAVTIVELCDWIPAVLTGTEDLGRMRRSRCAAGHKAMWHAEFGGYPSPEFLARLHPRLAGVRATLGAETWTSDAPFGRISTDWSARLGLPADCVVAVGAFDAHMGAVGGGIAPHRLLKIVGTSGLDMIVAPKTEAQEILVPGICGQVDGSIIPGTIGYEAGQSSYGDIFAWFKRLLCWPLHVVLPSLPGQGGAFEDLAREVASRVLPALEAAARALEPDETSLVALDWMNGRRTPDANQRLKAAVAGMSLGTDAPRIYRALVEATAFGARAIVERFRRHGIRIDDVIATGGVAKKSPLVMQVLADVIDMDIAISSGEQATALGAAMFAATAAGLYRTVEDAQRAMSSGTDAVYRPDPARARVYRSLYEKYEKLGAFVEEQLTA